MSLSPNSEHWLRMGERCVAADTIFTYCTGVDALNGRDPDVPRTLDDLRRCRIMLELVPELRSCLPRVANLSRQWAEVVNFWDDLCLLQDVEDPDWLTTAGRAPETIAMLNKFLDPTEQ